MNTRSQAFEKAIADLEGFEIDVNIYYEDAEPQGFYDQLLSGKFNTLSSFCQSLGWSDLSEQLTEYLPLCGNAVPAMENVQGFIVPEARARIQNVDIDSQPKATDWFWSFIHPRATVLAKPRFEAGQFGDAVEAVFKEVNLNTKQLVKNQTGKELDGSGLMTFAF